ncbi:hypothetical protein D0869_09141 [Hortaea werneckii]|uniref:Dolichol-phosphate mannosyltransferase subunit 3 n=2 Tax=Hortaea werneckii TaxID=91943 RepID=A0A3M6Z1L3_HORWE|nr:hypothetical protein D0869_09141 [Hortaea werneckii]RMX87798.1 hypothetical protein D0868_14919 [Hortaea werneckii]RMY08878.1 hypothetical protein D0867_08899 [Hortaea werneckii]RMY09173.1 hypothetical protein D0866_14661 [Hortaea werneckii]
MTRAQQQLSIGLLISSVYMAALLGLIPLPTKIQDDVVPYVRGQPTPFVTQDNRTLPLPKPQSPPCTNIHMPQKLPLWALITFGCLLLFQLGWGVFSFNDVPEAHDELMKEIQEAREDLTRKGVEVD